MTGRLLAALACAALLGACTQTKEAAQATPAAPDIKLYTMNCGEMHTSDADMFADDGAYKNVAKDLIVPCYLIRHPQGDLMWDTGLPQGLADLPNGITEGTYQMRMPHRLTDQLAQVGLTPADIEYVSVSHSHGDHIGSAALFTSATWIVDVDERAHAFRPEARADIERFGYAPLQTRPTRLIEGDADYDVFGDGSVKVIQAPGHTPGHTVLLVQLPHAGSVLLTGDLWHIAESRAARRVPRFNTDRAQTLATMDKVERIARETGARVVREHVPEDFAAMPAFPAYMN
ncbi:MAG: N-acyl homoserine lactonase family protein [Hyphomonadaceae bacterium]|nr:N-acyl homoserine lactonase family protein [Hyphomonadaceae bacterium]